VKAPSISVALATYNGERYLGEQLRSLERQSLPPAELVVCDDRSTDRTVSLVEDFARSSPFPVRLYVNETQLGFADNFLNAASMCRAEAVAFCDQDDVWHEEKLLRCAAEFAPGVVLVAHTSAVVDEHLRPLGRVFPRIRRAFVAEPLEADKWFHMPGMAMVFDAELLQVADWRTRPRSHFVPGGMVFHDEWIHVLAQVCGRIAFLSETLALYRQHGVNVTGAPGGRVSDFSRDALTVGLDYYRSRAGQAHEWAGLFGRLGDAEPDPARRDRYVRGAAFFDELGRSLELRVSVYEPEKRASRLARLLHVLRSGGYGSRSRGGFGARGLARDAMMVALGRGR
jgi:glycosyltransferase involved in cell wall biosynthesis